MYKEEAPAGRSINFFEKYLSIWVAVCIAIGVLIGIHLPAIPRVLSRFEYAQVSIPVALLIWLMIYPMMIKIDFSSIVNATRKPKGLVITLVMNWLVKPFTMYLFAWLFLHVIFRPFISPELARE